MIGPRHLRLLATNRTARAVFAPAGPDDAPSRTVLACPAGQASDYCACKPEPDVRIGVRRSIVDVEREETVEGAVVPVAAPDQEQASPVIQNACASRREACRFHRFVLPPAHSIAIS